MSLFPDRHLKFPAGLWLGVLAALGSVCRAAEESPVAPVPSARRWGVILQGLPGDAPHARQFRKVTGELRTWLVDSLEFPAEQVISLPESPGGEAEQAPPLTAEQIRSTLAQLTPQLQPDDAVWIFTVGHGSHDGQRAWFHVAGPDPSDVDLADWLAALPCREQVLWLTHSSSGWLVKPLSRPGRIVIAATAADDEPNETEFPQALASVVRRPPPPASPQPEGEGARDWNVAALYTAVVAEVGRRFRSDNRLPTEHAQLDDNGDGVGTETLNPSPPGDPTASTPSTDNPATTSPPKGSLPRRDGALARSVIVPDRRRAPASDPASDPTSDPSSSKSSRD